MNLEKINKWLYEEYGCSYTKLEELHDWLVEKNEKLQQENEQLKKQKEELKEWLNQQILMGFKYEIGYYKKVLYKINELEGEDKE